MSKTLFDLKTEAENRLQKKQWIDALKIYRLLIESAPLDFELRLLVGDVLKKLGKHNYANAVYQAIAAHDIKSGTPLRAMVALKLLSEGKINTAVLVKQLCDVYSKESTVLGRGIRPAPTDFNQAVRENIDLDYDSAPKAIVEEIAQIAAYTGNIQQYPPVVPPLAIFSTLSTNHFNNLFDVMTLKRFSNGESIITQGDPGQAIYFIARGEVAVVKTSPDTTGADQQMILAHLGPGSLFGEMALVSTAPRGASVVCEGNVDVLEIKKAHIDALSDKIPTIKQSMNRFTQERLIANLLATNPLFTPFDESQKKELLSRFTGHEVPPGTIFLEQGKTGNGLYVILHGEAEVLKWEGANYIKVATLSAGAVAGEISLITDSPVTATVRTTGPSTLLFLARELFLPLIEAVPELSDAFVEMTKNRLQDTIAKVKKHHQKQAFIKNQTKESVDSLSDDDIVFI